MLLNSTDLRKAMEKARSLHADSDYQRKCHLIAELLIDFGISERNVFNFEDALRQIEIKANAIRAEEEQFRPRVGLPGARPLYSVA